jgi:hypothetical protein
VEPDRELILEEARSIRDGLLRVAWHARDVAEARDARMEDENLDGKRDAV